MMRIIPTSMFKLAAKEEDFFSYDALAKDIWRTKLREAMDEYNIRFDTENDDWVDKKVITIPQTQWDFTKCQFACQLCKAGGDWEEPVIYFQCQLKKGYALDLHGNDMFCVIPGKTEGNPHLVKKKDGGLIAPDSDDAEVEADEAEAWRFLKKHLTELVEKEIENVK